MKTYFKNGTIITQNHNRDILRNAHLVIEDNRIAYVGSKPFNRRCGKVINSENLILTPGLINSHVHLGETVYQNLLPKSRNLNSYLASVEALTRKSSLFETGRNIIANYSMLGLLQSGTSTVCGGRTRVTAEKFGVRNCSGYMIMDSNKLKKYSLGLTKKFEHEYTHMNRGALCKAGIFVHSLTTINPSILPEVKHIVKKYPNLMIIAHVSETKEYEKKVKKYWKMSSVQVLNQFGLLSQNSILVHCNNVSHSDLVLIKKRRAGIVHCLRSNISLGNKPLNLLNLFKHNIKTCIATDGAVSAGDMNILNELRYCHIYYNRLSMEGVTLQRLFDLITIDAARVLGMDKDIGSIELGKRADIAVFETNHATDGSKDVFSLLLNEKYTQLKSLWINGVSHTLSDNKFDRRKRKIGVAFSKLVKKVETDLKHG